MSILALFRCRFGVLPRRAGEDPLLKDLALRFGERRVWRHLESELLVSNDLEQQAGAEVLHAERGARETAGEQRVSPR